MSFLNFLQTITHPPPLNHADMMNTGEGLAVFDFCNNNNIELDDLDFCMIDQWNLMDNGGASNQTMPHLAGMLPHADVIDISELRQNLVGIWTTSPWHWLPSSQDSGYQEQSNIAISSGDVAPTKLHQIDRVIDQKLDSSLRDRVLVIVLESCTTPAMASRIATSFPSAEVMDSLVHIFLASHACSGSSWIHMPSFRMITQWPDWIAVAAAAGGILTSVPTLRKFGLALQEAVREWFASQALHDFRRPLTSSNI